MVRLNPTWHKLLDVTKWQKEQAQIQLAHAMARQEKAERQLAQSERALQQLDTQLAARQKAGITVAQMREAEEYARYLQQRIHQEKQALKRAEWQTARSRETVIHYSREEKKWQFLIDKAARQVLEELRRKELRQLDEAAIQNYQRERLSGSERFEES